LSKPEDSRSPPTGAYPALDNIVDLLLDAVCVVDKEGRFVFLSAACERIFGYTQQELIGRPMIDLVAPADRARTLATAYEIMSGEPKFGFENRYVRKDGAIVHIMWSARWSEADQLRIAVARDITERKQAESVQTALYAISEAAHAAEDLPALFHSIHQVINKLLPADNFSVAMYDGQNDQLSFPYEADQSPDAIARYAGDKRKICIDVIRTGQPVLSATFGTTPAPDKQPAIDVSSAPGWLAVPLKSQRGIIGALVLRNDDQQTHYKEADKDLLQFVSMQVLIAIERKQLHEKLHYMAQFDDLTGLPNRALFYDRLEQALARSRRGQGKLALLYLDVDKFKQVNDSMGHTIGDLLLQAVARRLQEGVRKTDTVARLGGDEFVVILEDIQLPEYADMIRDKLRAAIGQPIELAGRVVRTRASIGIALFPEHGSDGRQLLKYADEAMYEEKRRGSPGQ
jgi:diguanylate cyclase (GGDEF)-like protein/PAS domain S-box-containing protein